MLLIHVPKLTNRLGYTLKVIFTHVLHADYSITTDEEYFLKWDDAKLSYGHKRIGDSPFIKCHPLLFETTIEEQEPHAECRDGQWRLYPVYGRDLDFDFDPLAATFFMVTRYEEYLPHREDEHGRFCPEDSLAMKEGFLDQPVVDQWARLIRNKIVERYPDCNIPCQSFRFVQTVDIDAAWCYKHKGTFRTVVGAGRDLFSRHQPDEVWRRLKVLINKEQDPYETFNYILHTRTKAPGSALIFFVLLADYDQYDKPASYLNPHFRRLLQHLDDYANMGIHPGYNTLEQPRTADQEIKRLESILHRPTVRSRYHFLRLKLPRSYRILQHAGIQNDYTMGYADVVGFRAGISVPFPFYDLERDHENELIIHPFCVMDTTLKKYLRLTPEEGLKEYKRIIDRVREVDGTYCCIVHNQNLNEMDGWAGWREAYEQMVEYAGLGQTAKD